MSISPIANVSLNIWNALSNASCSLASLVSEAVNGKCFTPDTHPNGTFAPVSNDFQVGYHPQTNQSLPLTENRTSAMVLARVAHPISLGFNSVAHFKHVNKKGFQLYDFTYEIFEQLCGKIERISEEKLIRLIVFTGHGFSYGLQIAQERVITADHDFRTCLEKVDSNALLIFSSCNIGRGPDPFAQWVADQTGRRVFAARNPVHADQLEFDDFPDKPKFGNGVEESGKMFYPSWRVPNEWEKVLRDFKRREFHAIEIELENAAYFDNYESVETILEMKVVTQSARGQAVENAARRHDWKMIEKILSYGPIWPRNSGLATVAAASGGHSDMIDYFYGRGPIHHRHTGEAVIAALEGGHGEKVVAPLLKRTIYTVHRQKALVIAAKKGHHAVVSLLLANDTIAEPVKKEALKGALDERHSLAAELLFESIYPKSDFVCMELSGRVQCLPMLKQIVYSDGQKKSPRIPEGYVRRTPTVQPV